MKHLLSAPLSGSHPDTERISASTTFFNDTFRKEQHIMNTSLSLTGRENTPDLLKIRRSRVRSRRKELAASFSSDHSDVFTVRVGNKRKSCFIPEYPMTA